MQNHRQNQRIKLVEQNGAKRDFSYRESAIRSSNLQGDFTKPSIERFGITPIFSALLALILCFGLFPTAALANDESTAKATGEATLAIVFGLNYDNSPNIVVNKTYNFKEGDTFESLLKAAVADGSLTAYELNASGYVDSLTKPGNAKLAAAADWTTYWSTFVDGNYYDGSKGSIKAMPLENGKSYQLAFDSYPTAIAPDWSTLDSPKQGQGVAGSANAGGSLDPAGRASLTVVHGLDFFKKPLIFTSASYDFALGATLKDLLNHSVAQLALGDYSLGASGYIDSFTSSTGTLARGAADWQTYWSMYVDGVYYGGSDTIETLVLEDGKSYQFAWSSYPSAAAPDWTLIPAPENSTSDTGNGDDNPGTNPGSSTPGAEYSQATFAALFTNITQQYLGTGEEWKALGLASVGKANAVNKDSILALAALAYEQPGLTNLQKSIMVLSSLGIDAAKLEYNGKTYNLLERLSASPNSNLNANAKMSSLLAYASLSTSPDSSTQAQIKELINDVLALQNSDGGWSLMGSVSDVDMTAYAITALAPHKTFDTRIETALQKGLKTLKGMQLSNGGFASYYSNGEMSVNSTAWVIIALAAAGIDVQTWIYVDAGIPASTAKLAPDPLFAATSNAAASNAASGTVYLVANAASASPLNALFSQANKEQTGFLYGGVTEDNATQQGYFALVAYQGFKNTGTAYNIYTQAAQGVAGLASLGNNNDATAGNSAGDVAGELPATGDKGLAAGAAAGVIALCALLCLARYNGLRKRAL